MIGDFFDFVLNCFKMVVRLFANTVIDGVSYDVLIVAACMLSIVLTSIVVRFRPGFRPPRPERLPKTKGKSEELD